ncbi:MAG: hypothetical protein M1833_006154 [Piccolia ochrophora]|nr:MAG: hypothetical protein M1833_006154 [Piccolia ochrophora]
MNPSMPIRRQGACQLCLSNSRRLFHQPFPLRRFVSQGYASTLRAGSIPSPRPKLLANASLSLSIGRRTVQRASTKPLKDGWNQLGPHDVELPPLYNGIVNSPTVPSEEQVMQVARGFEEHARMLVDAPSKGLKSNPLNGKTPSSALLSLDDNGPPSATERPSSPSSFRPKPADALASLFYRLLLHPPVFISPTLLAVYSNTMNLLRRPATLPNVFTLYASKPLARPSKNPSIPDYKSPNPSSAKYAIPSSTASTALAAAINTRSLSTALSIITTSYAAPAFQRAKLLRSALLPGVATALFPLAAYTVASKLSVYQDTMDTAFATNIIFAGLVAYVGFTATIGVVALTTANDQMERVTWAPGMPLRERWLREEERAAIDRVACAWGFRDRLRWGEEEGHEWDALRDWVARRGMIVDRVELLEGME